MIIFFLSRTNILQYFKPDVTVLVKNIRVGAPSELFTSSLFFYEGWMVVTIFRLNLPPYEEELCIKV